MNKYDVINWLYYIFIIQYGWKFREFYEQKYIILNLFKSQKIGLQKIKKIW